MLFLQEIMSRVSNYFIQLLESKWNVQHSQIGIRVYDLNQS